MTHEDSLFVVLGAGKMELCWPFVMMHRSPQPANKKKTYQLLVEKDVFAFHITLYCNKDFHYWPTPT
jgi:hypothetical protein